MLCGTEGASDLCPQPGLPLQEKLHAAFRSCEFSVNDGLYLSPGRFQKSASFIDSTVQSQRELSEESGAPSRLLVLPCQMLPCSGMSWPSVPAPPGVSPAAPPRHHGTRSRAEGKPGNPLTSVMGGQMGGRLFQGMVHLGSGGGRGRSRG